MATQQHDVDDPDMDINPFTMVPPQSHEEGQFQQPPLPSPADQKQQLLEHFLSSIKSILLIKQLPSEGLSFQLWPAATTLVTLLDRHCCDPTISGFLSALFRGRDSCVPSRILELGSGTGLVGIAAAALLGANVTVTDLPHVLPNLRFNIEANAGILEANGGTVNAAALCWGDIAQMEAIGREYDYILASDVVYHDHLFEPLLKTLKWFLLRGNKEKRIIFVMAHLKRWKKESAFFKKAKRIFDVEIIHIDTPSNGSRIGVIVYTFVAKAVLDVNSGDGAPGHSSTVMGNNENIQVL